MFCICWHFSFDQDKRTPVVSSLWISQFCGASSSAIFLSDWWNLLAENYLAMCLFFIVTLNVKALLEARFKHCADESWHPCHLSTPPCCLSSWFQLANISWTNGSLFHSWERVCRTVFELRDVSCCWLVTGFAFSDADSRFSGLHALP